MSENEPLHSTPSAPGNLLVNGDMDQQGFYWRPPNHWIAGSWFEWFSRQPFNFPEFNDGYERGFHHTYPSSQRLQLWGNDYAAGLIQSVVVTPCTYYRFEAYGQSRPGSVNPPPVDVDSHMKVGIEPNGWMSDRSIFDYDPGLEPEDFPDTVVWSPEATHPFVWQPYTVTAEVQGYTVTVILSSYPEINSVGGVEWNDTLWDSASLVQAPPPSSTLLYESLPVDDGLITNLDATLYPRMAIIEWDTVVEASSQVLYRVLAPPTLGPPTESFSHSLYLPTLITWESFSLLTSGSPIDQTPVLQHRVVLSGLPDTYRLEFAALSRRLDDEACVTSVSQIVQTKFLDKSYTAYLPANLRGE